MADTAHTAPPMESATDVGCEAPTVRSVIVPSRDPTTAARGLPGRVGKKSTQETTPGLPTVKVCWQ